MYKAAFIDMDGTLLRKDHTISDTTKQVIRNLVAKGVMIIPVSGRALHAILPITNPVIDTTMPVVSLNGSYIYRNGSIIHQVMISLEDTMELYRQLADYDASVMYFSQMEWYATGETDLIRKEQKITGVPVIIQSFSKLAGAWKEQGNGPNKILVAGDNGLVHVIEEKLLALKGSRLNIYQSQTGYLEVMDRAASKSTGIQFLLSELGLQREEIIAIGDNFNDKGMIEYAGMGIAMGNAPDEIKSVADYITDTNENDGVARALQHFFDQ